MGSKKKVGKNPMPRNAKSIRDALKIARNLFWERMKDREDEPLSSYDELLEAVLMDFLNNKITPLYLHMSAYGNPSDLKELERFMVSIGIRVK